MPTREATTTIHEESSGVGADYIADKIIHYLMIYPIISPTMLQSALGPGLSPKLWRPILEGLITAGIVDQSEMQAKGPAGRHNSYTQLRLTDAAKAQYAERLAS